MATAELLRVSDLWPISEGKSGFTGMNNKEKYGPVNPDTLLRALTLEQRAEMGLFIDCMKRMGIHDNHLTETGRLCPYRQFEIEKNERRCICDCAEFEALINAIKELGSKEVAEKMKNKEIAFIARDDHGKIMAPCDNCLAWLQDIDMHVFSYQFQLTNAREIPVINHFR